MDIEFDPNKSARNAFERDLPFDLVREVEWELAITFIDRRFDYGEDRFVAMAPRNQKIYVICYVIRGTARRIVSFRRANKREMRVYDEATAHR